MADRVLIPVPGLGTLALTPEALQEALAAGAGVFPRSHTQTGQGDEPLVDAEELARQLRIPVTWIEQAAREERIPSLPFGRWRRFRRSEVEAAVRSQRGNGS